jgi:hypothetical protein
LGYLEAVEWNTIALVTQIMIGCTTPTIANPNTIEVGFKPDFILARRMIATMTSSPRVCLAPDRDGYAKIIPNQASIES